MRLELDATRFDEGLGDFDIGHILFDTQTERQVEIVKFSGFSEIDDAGAEHETLYVHLCGTSDDIAGVIEFDDLDRAVFTHKTITPISPAWFVDEVNGNLEEAAEAEAEAKAKSEIRENTKRLIAEIKGKAEARPLEHWNDTELFAKVSGAPLSVAEEMLISYEGNLARMAGSTPKQLQQVANLTQTRAEKIAATFELSKRLARFHATRDKITSAADIADLLMSKLRYLQKEVVIVLCLDTKGQVTSTGKLGEIADDLRWGKMLGESQVFEGTLNACVFHPREIFRFAIEEAANSIVIAHNHPSGDPQPSQEDIRATKQLMEAGNQVGIRVLDHIVIGDGIFVSLKEENLI